MEARLRTANSLVRRLSSAGDEESVAAAVAEIRLLSKHDTDARLPLAEAGAVPLLAHRLLSAGDSADAVTATAIEEDAAAALLNLSISARDALMSSPILLDALAAALRMPSAAAHAAAALFSLLSVDDSHRRAIASKPEILSSLVALIRNPPDPSARAVKDALKALFGVALHPPSRSALISLGVVPPLFSVVVQDGRKGLVEDATAVIAQVAGCGDSPAEFRKAGGVRVLVDLVEAGRGASERARENAAAALLSLVRSGGGECALTAEEAREVEERVRELAEGRGSERGRDKAQALLRALGSQRDRFADFGSDSPPPLSSSSSSAPAAL